MLVTCFVCDKHVFFPLVITQLCHFVRLKLISYLNDLQFLKENSYCIFVILLDILLYPDTSFEYGYSLSFPIGVLIFWRGGN